MSTASGLLGRLATSGASRELRSRLAGSALRRVRPVRDRWQDEHGWCVACGRASRFAFNSWVIPLDQFEPEDAALVLHAYRRRESLLCAWCNSSLRVRCLAAAAVALFGGPGMSFAQLLERPSFRRLDVAEMNPIGSADSLHRMLLRLPKLAYSSYSGRAGLGQIVGGVRNEDLCNLTYPDGSFDLLLSSDTLEHVPDVDRAIAETLRVLRPGGVHLFTVPLVATRPGSLRRAVMRDEQVEHELPPRYHGRGSGAFRFLPAGDDLLTFSEFGGDLAGRLEKAGFEVEVLQPLGEDVTGAGWVFSTRVPA